VQGKGYCSSKLFFFIKTAKNIGKHGNDLQFSVISSIGFNSRAVHKRRLHKIAKNWLPLLVRKMSALAQPVCPCGHTLNFEKPEIFCTKKCGHPDLKYTTTHFRIRLDTPLDCGRLLWIAPSENGFNQTAFLADWLTFVPRVLEGWSLKLE